MASKNLARTGASLVNRFFPNPFLRQSPNPNPNQRIVSQGLDVTPKLFPSLSKFENSLHLPQYQNDAELIRKVASEGFVYPSGLPSLSFYLPEGDVSSSNEPMILFPKWTFQPSTIRCKRDHGFFARWENCEQNYVGFACTFSREQQGNQGWEEGHSSKNSEGPV